MFKFSPSLVELALIISLVACVAVAALILLARLGWV